MYTMTLDNQSQISIKVFTGEDSNPQNNKLIGNYEIEGLSFSKYLFKVAKEGIGNIS